MFARLVLMGGEGNRHKEGFTKNRGARFGGEESLLYGF